MTTTEQKLREEVTALQHRHANLLYSDPANLTVGELRRLITALSLPEQQAPQVAAALLAADSKAGGEPVDMVLYCPKCGMQHIDAMEYNSGRIDAYPSSTGGDDPAVSWTNPPHKSHLCHGCGHIWRPSDTPTNGVERTASGKDANTRPQQQAKPLTDEQKRILFECVDGGKHWGAFEYFMEGFERAERAHGIGDQA